MTESIRIIYSPINDASLFGFFQAYHETLVYTNSAGVTSYASAAPSISPTGSVTDKIYDVAQGAAAAAADAVAGANIVPSVNGTLVCASGNAAQVEAALGLSDAQFKSETSADNPSATVLSSSGSLASQWATVQSSCTQVSALSAAYSAATQNSNTAVSTELAGAGIALPTDNGFNGSHWAPGSENILHTANTTASAETTATSSTSNGITTVDVTDKNSAGTVTDTEVYTYNAAGTSSSGTLSTTSAGVSANVTETVSGGTTTDTISGTGPNSLNIPVSFGQTDTTNSAGVTSVTATNGAVAAQYGPKESVDFDNATVNLGARAQAIEVGNDDTIVTGSANLGKGGGTIGTSIDIRAGTGDTVTGLSNNIEVSNSDDSLTANGSSATITFDPSTALDAIQANSEHIVDGSGSDLKIVGNSDTATLGSGDQVLADGTGDVITASGDTIDVAAGESLTVSGSNDIIVGSGSNTINLTGTGDHVYDDSSVVDFSGTNTGDMVSGSGDSGSGWGGYSNQGGQYGGYYGGGYYSGFSRAHAAGIAGRGNGASARSIADLAADDQRLPASYSVGHAHLSSRLDESDTSVSQTSVAPRLATVVQPSSRPGYAPADLLIHAMASFPSHPSASTRMDSGGVVEWDADSLAAHPAREGIRAKSMPSHVMM